MFPLGVVGGLQETTSVELSGEFVCKSVTGPDTGIKWNVKFIAPIGQKNLRLLVNYSQ